MEAENQDMANDLKQLTMAKQESERKRKQQDGQLSEMTIKLAELDRSKTDASEKLAKVQVRTRKRCPHSPRYVHGVKLSGLFLNSGC